MNFTTSVTHKGEATAFAFPALKFSIAETTIGRDDNGKRKLKNIYADTIRELGNKIAEVKTEYNKGTLITVTVTMQDLCRTFLDSSLIEKRAEP